MEIKRSKEWWLSRIDRESESPIGAGTQCDHLNFAAEVDVHRLTNEAGEVTGYMADLRIRCAHCGRRMQFLGLPNGVNTRGAAASIDDLEAHLAIIPEGQEPSALGQIAAIFQPVGKKN